MDGTPDPDQPAGNRGKGERAAMDDATGQSGETIAELARKMTAERRGRFLDAACGGDPQLRADVEARLQAGVAEVPPTAGDEAAADQAEPQGSSPDPFDAMVLEAVSTTQEPEESPAEEASDGTPILAYCREKGLDPVARLRLFQQVCRLVDEDHRRGAIDGGLTPERILIGPDGEPGISEGAGTSEETDDAGLLRYTSPEQILGEPITTATDVYGLGAILYELLTGSYPYRTAAEEAGRDELIEAISQRAGASQSAVAPEGPQAAGTDGTPPGGEAGSRAKLRKLLDGDLDLIVLKALQKEPERRYRSAAAMAEDIDRIFEGRPVLAHQPGKLYVAGKFFRPPSRAHDPGNDPARRPC